jgi:transposase
MADVVWGEPARHQKEMRSMKYYAGLDVSIKETSVCVLDDEGRIVREVVASGRFEARICKFVEDRPELEEIMRPLLAARRGLRDRFAELHRKVLDEAKADTVCRRLMTIPGVGPVVALAYTATIDVPARFRGAAPSAQHSVSRRHCTNPARRTASAATPAAATP